MKKSGRPAPNPPCPCGSLRPYAACCAQYHSAATPPPDAETLMRARYAAYCLGNAEFLLATWHPDHRPEELDLNASPAPKWLGLKVLRHTPVDADHAEVEFVARYRVQGRAQRLHETSRFLRESGRWLYLDGDLHADLP